MQKQITIIGAGLVGSLLSIYLSKQGYQVNIYERRSDMRKIKMQAGRSINLSLSDRGIRALKEVGVLDEVSQIAIPMHGRQMHHIDSTQSYQAYGKEGQSINSVSRGELNCTLMDLAEKNNVNIHFNERCDQIDWTSNEIHFTNTEKSESHIVKQDLIFGSDGAFAASRLTHQLQHNRFNYDQSYIDFGYKELTIPAGENGAFLMEKYALHIWPRGNYMLIALPNIDGSFTCTLFFPFDGNPSFKSINTPEKSREFFNETFPDAAALMPELEKEFFNNATSSLVTVRCFPWIRDDKFALIGDAAHAIVPFFGQGMNCGFEDCVVLNQLITKHNHNWTLILDEYQILRKPDADAIATLALNNFVEMRDKVADETFILQKKIEAHFSAKHPEKWTPAYSLVTFSPEVRYSEALSRGNAQQGIMDKVMKTENIQEIWNSVKIEEMMLAEINKMN